MKKIIILTFVLVFSIAAFFIYKYLNLGSKITKKEPSELNPLSIRAMRNKDYPGSNIVIEEKLSPGSNYQRYVASYKSEGLKIYALLTVPDGTKPDKGWPAIVFNHGYIPPEIYKTTERYVAYVDVFARNGYVVFKPDYRGNGSSEGKPEGAYYSPAYTVDDLNAISSIKKYKDVDTNKIGLWGHSMGGNITLRDLVVRPKEIKAAVIWGGVIGSYYDLMNSWRRRVPFRLSSQEASLRANTRQKFIDRYGDPKANPDFWSSIDPTYFSSEIETPLQLHHGTDDEEVPIGFSESLYKNLKDKNKTIEFYTYQGADHDISDPSFNLAMDRSVNFFNKYLK